MLVTYTVHIPYQQTIEVADGMDDEAIRAIITSDIPKYLSVRTYDGIGEDAEYFSE